MANGYTPGTPASEELKTKLFREACPGCERTAAGQNQFQCAIIQALRNGTLLSKDTAGYPCAKILFCKGCENVVAASQPCLAETAAEILTTAESVGMYTKVTCAAALKQAPTDCPLQLAGLI